MPFVKLIYNTIQYMVCLIFLALFWVVVGFYTGVIVMLIRTDGFDDGRTPNAGDWIITSAVWAVFLALIAFTIFAFVRAWKFNISAFASHGATPHGQYSNVSNTPNEDV